MVASSLSSPQFVRDSSSKSSSIARDINSSVMANHTEFVGKAEVRPVIVPEAQLRSEVPLSEFKTVENPGPSPLLRTKSTNMPDTEMLSETMEVAPSGEASSLDNLGTMGGSRRKDRMAPPARLSERINTVKRSKTEVEHHTSEEDDFYQDWSGGSRYEVDNKPWSILGWITEGFKNRLQRK